MWFFLEGSILREFLLGVRQDISEFLRPEFRNKVTVNILMPAYQIAGLRQQVVGVFTVLFE